MSVDPTCARLRPDPVACVVALAGAAALTILPAPSLGVSRLSVVGSRALSAPVADWVSIYAEEHPRGEVKSAMYGSGLAASAMAERRADVAPMARPLGTQERALLRERGQPVAIPVGMLSGGAARPVYLYMIRDRAGRVNAAVVDFARIALSPRGQARLKQAHLVPLTADRRAAAQADLARLNGRDEFWGSR